MKPYLIKNLKDAVVFLVSKVFKSDISSPAVVFLVSKVFKSDISSPVVVFLVSKVFKFDISSPAVVFLACKVVKSDISSPLCFNAIEMRSYFEKPKLKIISYRNYKFILEETKLLRIPS